MSKIKLNINNASQVSNSDIVERARKQLGERKMLDEKIAPKKKTKTGLLVFAFIFLISASNAALYFFLKNKSDNSYKKFIPKGAVVEYQLPLEELKEMFDAQEYLIFHPLLSKISLSASSLGIDIKNVLSQLKKDVVAVSAKKPGGKNLSHIIFIEIPEGFNLKEIENKLKQNFNVSYNVYRGENIILVSSLNAEEKENNFCFSVMGNVAAIAGKMEDLKLAIDAGK